jgi:hypothetical protein
MDRKELDALSHAVTQDVLEKLDQRPALAKLFQDYPEIKADPGFAEIADRYYDVFTANGATAPKAIEMAGERVGAKFKLGRFATEKKGAPSGGDQDGQSESDVIAEMRRSRPGSQESF